MKPCFRNPYTDQMVRTFCNLPKSSGMYPSTPRNRNINIYNLFQLKNMVSALFQSRPRDRGGTRTLKKADIAIRWKTMEDMYNRELN